MAINLFSSLKEKNLFFFFWRNERKESCFQTSQTKKLTKLKRVLITANQLLEDAKDDSKIAQFPEFQNEKVVSLINKLLEDIYC